MKVRTNVEMAGETSIVNVHGITNHIGITNSQ